MSDEVKVGDDTYVSSKRAAEISGYAQDYIGHLCRKGLIDAQRMGGLWYLTLDSLYEYKKKADSYRPEPPRRASDNRVDQEPQTAVSFDGKEYISATRAAEITGYHQDYVGQLAREGKVLSRQVGNRWYVERTGVTSHKKQKDALLGAVQAEAVGLARPPQPASIHDDTTPFFTYTSDEGDLLPIPAASTTVSVQELAPSATAEAEEHQIPIRVVEASIPLSYDRVAYSAPQRPEFASRSSRTTLSWVPVAIATVVIVLAVGYVSVAQSGVYAKISPESASALANRANQALGRVGDILEAWLAPEISYRRDF